MAKLAKATSGSTTHNTGEMPPMETGRRRISLAGRELAARVAGSRVLGLELARVVAQELAHVRAVAELERVQVAEAELEHGPAAGGLVLVRVVVERELGRVAVERELAQAVAALETDQPHGHLAILAETKSVTVARHRGLAHLVVEDLAAVAEIMPERAATEVAAAWVAAE